MDLDFLPEHAEFRKEVRDWIEANFPAENRRKMDAGEHLTKEDILSWHRILNNKGWLTPSWPVEYGGTGWDSVRKYIFSEELARAQTSQTSFGIGMIGPVLYTFGTPEQKAKFLPGTMNGDIWWCQGYSEPGAGSDLAGLSTRAERIKGDDGKEYYVVNGQKTWTTQGHFADWGFFLVRTDATAKKQEGISFLLIDMTTPGITVRPIITIEGGLLSNTGTLVPDGVYNMQFDLYTVASGGTTQWTEDRLVTNTQGVTIRDGYFSVRLGEYDTFPSTINWDQEQWLGLTVRGTTNCAWGSCSPADSEMSPRFKLTAVPYAFRAEALQKTSGANEVKVTTTTPTADITYIFEDTTAGTYNVCTTAATASCLSVYSGGGSSLFTDSGSFTYLTATADDFVLGASTVGGAALFVDVSAGSATLGNSSLAGSIVLSDGTSNTGTIQTAALNANRTYTLPDADGTLCLTSGNCAGVGGTGDILNNGQNGTVRIGSNDASSVILESNNMDRLTINSSGDASFSGALGVTGATTLSSTLAVTGVTTLSGNLLSNGNTTIGDATSDRLTVTSQILGGTPLVFQGATDNAFTTSILVTNPTANNSITLPDASGTVILSGHTFTSDVTGTLGASGTTALTIAADSVALGTDTTGNYVAGNTAGTGIAITGTASEAWSPTISLDYTSTLASNPTLAADLSSFGSTGLLFEGSTADTNEALLTVADPTADNTYTLPNASGTIITTGNFSSITATGTVTSGTWQGGVIADAYINDALTISSSGTVDWLALSNYPTACAVGTAVTTIGDTLTCTAFLRSSDIGVTVQGYNANTTVLGATIDLATAEVSGTLGVTNGGTGAATFISNGIIYGNGTGALQVTAAGTTGQCLVATTGAAPSWGTCTAGSLQAAYNASTNPEITLDATRGALTIRDASTPIGANLLEVQNNSGTTTYFGVTASGVTVDGDLTVTSGNYISLVGGNTASRPASPTEGMVYYDTTTKQLLAYANGKWQADRTDAVLVAASNSSQADKDIADYVADGNTGASNDGDQIQINSALAAASGRKVVLLAGTYVADETVLVPNNTILTGVGLGTVIELADLDIDEKLIENSDSSTGTGVVIRDLKIDGRNDLNTAGDQYAIYLNGMGSGSSGTARQGAKVANVYVSNFNGWGISLNNSDNNGISDSTIRNSGLSIQLNNSSDNNIVSGNTIQGNGTGSAIVVQASSYNTITENVVQENYYGVTLFLAFNNTIVGNVINDSTAEGMYIYDSNLNTIAANTVQGSGLAGIYIQDADKNIVASNTIHDNGSTTANLGIEIVSNSLNNSITGNAITDTSASVNNFAISIEAGSNNNYLADNTYSGPAGYPATINDAGTNTRYASQLTPAQVLQSGSSLIKANATNVITGSIDPIASTSVTGVGTFFTTELQVGDRITVSGETRTITAISSATALTVDTAFSDNANDTSVDRLPAALRVTDSTGANQLVVKDNGVVELGNASTAGLLSISDGSSSTITLKSATQVAATNYDLTIPAITASDTFCLQTLNNCPGNSKFTDSGTLTYLTSSTDQLSIGSSSDLNGKLQVVNDDAADSALVIRAAVSQSAPLIVAQDSSGTEIFRIGYRPGSDESIFLGSNAGASNTTWWGNTGIGYFALSADGGYDNTAVGKNAGRNVTGQNNAFFGNVAGLNVSSANYNTAVGSGSLYSAAGDYNTAVGYSALNLLVGGQNNIALGDRAGDNLTSGDGNIIIGSNIDFASATGSNQLNIAGLLTSTDYTSNLSVDGSTFYVDATNDRAVFGGTSGIAGFQVTVGDTLGNSGIAFALQSGGESVIDFNGGQGTDWIHFSDTDTSFDVKVGGVTGLELFTTGLIVNSGSATLGTTSQAGTLKISDGSSNSVGINVNPLAGNYTVSVPTITADDTFCLFTLNNCVNANAFVQNGNSFTAAATLGTNDAYTLAFETNNITRITLDTSYKAYFGNGATNATPQGFTLQGTSGSGTNITGAGLTIASGQGTGTGTSGNITFQYAPAGASGSSLNALQTACTISGTNGSLSCPGAGSDSERFGAGATAGGSQAVALGNSASAGGNISTAIGYLAVANTYGSTVLGYGANAPGTNSLALGVNATGNTDAAVAVGFGAISGQNGSSLGYQALSGFAATALGTNTSANNFGSIAIGSDAATTAANQLVVGGNSTAYLSDAYFGSGVTSANAASRDFVLHATGGSGTNIGGADFTLAAGQGTGTGVGGAILFQTAASGASGSSLNALTTRAEIQADGDLAVDTNTLFVDATNNRVGVGLTNPASPLEVVGAIRSSSTAGQGSFEVRDTGSLSASLYDGSGAGNVGILDLYSGGTNNVRLRADTGVSFINAGNFGVGDVSPASKLVVSGDANDAIFGNIVRVTGNLTSSTNGQFGIGVRPSVVPSSASTQEYVGLYTDIQATASNVSGATIVGFKSNAKLGTTATSALQNVYGFMANPTNSNTTYTLTNNVGFYSQNPGSTGVITNNYGVFIESQTRGTNDYGIYVQGADTYALWSDSGANRFDGVTTIGADSTTTALTVTGGGADAAVATSTSGILVLGATNSTNIVMDADEIIARNNGATSTLNLQSEGGATILGAATNARAELNVSGHAAFGSTAAGAYSTTSASIALHVSEDFTDTSGAVYGTVSRSRANPASSSTAGYTGVLGQALLDTNQNAGSLTGGSFYGQINVALTGTNTVTTLYGVRASVGAVNGSGSSVAVIPTATAFEGQVDNRGLSITSARGATLSGVAVNGGTITNSYGLLVNQGSIGTGGGITSQVGVAIASHDIGTNNTDLLIGTTTPVAGNYSIYSSSANASFFNGTVDVNFNGAVTVNGVCHSGADIDAATNVSRTLVACSAAPNDYAEFYPAEAGVEAGDIVATTNNLLTYEASGADPETGIVHSLGTKQISIVKKAILGDSSIGIISTAPYQTIGKDIPVSANRKPLALSGRVPVKVNNQGGNIAVGDKIALSTVPGVGKKADVAGLIVGTALEPFNGVNGVIYVLVDNSYYEPPAGDNLQGSLLNVIGNGLFGGDVSIGGSLNVSGPSTLSSLSVSNTATIANLVVSGDTVVNKLTVNGKIITAGSTPTAVMGASTTVGQGGSVDIEGNDIAGSITYIAGNVSMPTYGLSPGSQVEVIFNEAYAAIPRVSVTPTSESASDINYYISKTSTGFKIYFKSVPLAGQTYSFDYQILQ